ncbi:hypothetical protein ATW7_13918 [Alteromonadales bacterium TW-7]|nr:hypothetical protein ATW7_13918 [Alteromonadales bacterium TW-7]
MIIHVKHWLKCSPHPFAKSLFQFAKTIRNPQMIVIPFFHSSLYFVHQFLKQFIHEFLRIIYLRPFSKAKLKAVKNSFIYIQVCRKCWGSLMLCVKTT